MTVVGCDHMRKQHSSTVFRHPMSEACIKAVCWKLWGTAFCWYDFGARTTGACVTVHHSQPEIAKWTPVKIPTINAAFWYLEALNDPQTSDLRHCTTSTGNAH
jgi:hypothetical protein